MRIEEYSDASCTVPLSRPASLAIRIGSTAGALRLWIVNMLYYPTFLTQFDIWDDTVAVSDGCEGFTSTQAAAGCTYDGTHNVVTIRGGGTAVVTAC